MRAIAKGAEPQSLIEHRANQHCDYDNFEGKDDLRAALVREQCALCCYCMGRIRANTASMKVEHWRCQARFAADELSYSNLLGACRGGEGRPTKQQHCDTRKGDQDLKWNPAEPLHPVEARISYGMDGSIRSDDVAFDRQLDEVLNLNLAILKNNRESVLTGLLQWWKGSKPVPRKRIEKEIEQRTGGNGELQPYCQVAVWWLRRKLEA